MPLVTINLNLTSPTGTYNGRNYWDFEYPEGSGNTYTLRFGVESVWEIVDQFGTRLGYSNETNVNCPDVNNFTSWVPDEEPSTTIIDYNLTSCSDCNTIQERIFREFQAIKVPTPSPTIEHSEPFKCCDERLLVLATTNETASYKNDVTSAWIKLSSASDTVTFELTKDGVTTNYTPTPVAFPNEPNAFYVTIPWQSVLNLDGAGCYKLELRYNIGGIASTITWGIYQLKEFSLSTAEKTARLRAKYNLKQSIEGIDFTNANVEDTIRFFGFIGNRQPNMEVDNLIYSDRVVKSVVRENLNTYEIKTDPYTDTLINYLTDLVLLSENELYISDYNSFNHSHKILDLPVIVQDSPEIDYLEAYQRKAVLTCIVGDKNKNKRTYY